MSLDLMPDLTSSALISGAAYLSGEITYEQMEETIKQSTRHFAKRQLTWFKREKDVRWLNLPDFHNDRTEVLNHILQEISGLWN